MLRFQNPPSGSQKSRLTKPLQVPQRGPLWRQSPVSTAFFYMSLEILNKISPNKQINFSLLSKALGKERPPMFPKTGPLWKKTPISRALLGLSFGVPSQGALPPDAPHRAPTKKEAPFPKPSFTHHSKSPVYEPASRFPSGAPMEKDARLQSLPLHFLQGPH